MIPYDTKSLRYKLGPVASDQLKALQRQHGLDVTGRRDLDTLRVLAGEAVDS